MAKKASMGAFGVRLGYGFGVRIICWKCLYLLYIIDQRRRNRSTMLGVVATFWRQKSSSEPGGDRPVLEEDD